MKYTEILKEAGLGITIPLAALGGIGALVGKTMQIGAKQDAALLTGKPANRNDMPFALRHPYLTGALSLGIAPAIAAEDYKADVMATAPAHMREPYMRGVLQRRAAKDIARGLMLGKR